MDRDFCFFIFAFIFNLYYYVPISLASPIIGGTVDQDFTIKHHVAVFTKDPGQDYEYICGGSIVGEKYVMTAAHCFIEVESGTITTEFALHETPAKVKAGTNKLHGQGIERNVVKIFIPGTYSIRPKIVGDLAILQLSEDLGARFSDRMDILHIGQVHDSAQNVRGSFCGYGNYEGILDNGNFVVLNHNSEINIYLNVDIMDTTDVFGKHTLNSPYLIARAAGTTNHAGPCDGDSGGGLFYEGFIVGVLSEAPQQCNTNNVPAIFTRIWDFMSFVNLAMNKNAHHSDMYVLEGPSSHQSSSHHGQNPSSSRRIRKFHHTRFSK